MEDVLVIGFDRCSNDTDIPAMTISRCRSTRSSGGIREVINVVTGNEAVELYSALTGIKLPALEPKEQKSSFSNDGLEIGMSQSKYFSQIGSCLVRGLQDGINANTIHFMTTDSNLINKEDTDVLEDK